MNSSAHTPWRGLLLIVAAAGIPTTLSHWGRERGTSVPAREVCSPGEPLISILQEVSQPSATGFSALAANASREEQAGGQQGADRAGVKPAPGRIRGVIRFPEPSPLSPVANLAGEKRPLLRIDVETRALADAVVFLADGDKLPQPAADAPAGDRAEPGQPSKPAKPGKSSVKAVPVQAVMDQKDHEFTPRVVAIRAGAGVRFTNSDVANHNVHGHGLDTKNQFNVFTGGGASHVQRFRAEKGQRPIRIGCDIHPWMQGWVFVFEHPWFAVTTDAGEFELTNVPPGRHRLTIRHPAAQLELTREVELAAQEDCQLEIDLRPAPMPEKSSPQGK
jgi:plastocyanin